MQRVSSIELTEEETATVWCMAALSGYLAAQIVRHIHRTTLFQIAVSLATGEWSFRNDETGEDKPDPTMQQQRFREFMSVILDGCRERGN